MSSSNVNRRDFMRLSALGTTVLGMGVNPFEASARPVAPSDKITVGMIAVGARAHGLIDLMQRYPDVEIVAVCDAYKGRIERAISRTEGRAKAIADYREMIQRADIDAVVISSPDHWHYRHSVDTLNAGKHAYIEKPLTYTIDEGMEIVKAQKKNGLAVQVGSPGPNSILATQARDMIAAGKLGQVTMIRAYNNRNTASGAWIYPIPPDASPETVDWNLFLGSAPKLPYDDERFFRWRCYRDYSGGISTDLFVHTCTTINYIMGADMCDSVAAMGGLYRWKDSRDVSDTINASLRYPQGFMVSLSGTANNEGGGGEGMQILGTEGTLILGRDLTFIPERVNEDNGWIVNSWPEQLEKDYYADLATLHEERPATRPAGIREGREVYSSEGMDGMYSHMLEFFDAVRNGTPTKEDALVGHHAAACAHMINQSIDSGRTVHWDPSTHGLATSE